MRNVLKRMKTQFSDFLFFDLRSFLYSKQLNFRWIFKTIRKKNKKDQHQPEIRLLSNLPENGNYNRNLVKIEFRKFTHLDCNYQFQMDLVRIGVPIDPKPAS